MIKLLVDLRFLRVGAQLKITELMRAWNGTGLRTDDLSEGLNESLEAGILDFAGSGAGASVSLTAAGASWIDSAEGKNEIAAQRPILEAAQQRRLRGAVEQRPPTFDRRLRPG